MKRNYWEFSLVLKQLDYFSSFCFGTDNWGNPAYLFSFTRQVSGKHPFLETEDLTAYEIGQELGGN